MTTSEQLQDLPGPNPGQLVPFSHDTGYTVGELSQALGLSVAEIRAYARLGLVHPAEEDVYSFDDLVLLQAAKGLKAAKIPPHRIRKALAQLPSQLPDGRAMATVHLIAMGREIVARDGNCVWNPESGQALFDFAVSEPAEAAIPIGRTGATPAQEQKTAQECYESGCEAEGSSEEEARLAYGRALELDPQHVDSHLNLGRLLHEAGDLTAAEDHYRQALETNPGDPVAAFNLGVVLQDRGEVELALGAYEHAVDCDPTCRDAYFNAAGLYEDLGEKAAALRLLKRYRSLLRGEDEGQNRRGPVRAP